VNQLNAHGGLWDGRKVAVFAADDKADAANAKAVARQVIARGIRFVIGPYNSSVGIANLALYRASNVLPLWMTSRDETAGVGATVQPMNTQIAPVERALRENGPRQRVAMLVDDTPNGAFTQGMATGCGGARARRRFRDLDLGSGGDRSWGDGQLLRRPGGGGAQVEPGLVYVSTYFPAGTQIAKALRVRH
jgi:hypothetical protein